MKEIKMTMNEKQAQVIKEALELYSRLLIGQVDELKPFYLIKKDLKVEDIEELNKEMAKIKSLIFPELTPNGYYSIYSKEINEQEKISHDIFKVLNNVLNNKDFTNIDKASKEEIPKITVRETN